MKRNRLTAVGLAVGLVLAAGAPLAAQAVEDESGIRYDTVFAWSYLGSAPGGEFMYTNQYGETFYAAHFIGDGYYGTESDLANEVARQMQGG
ncbi:MAG: hypothetical protein ACRDT7_00185 [Microbacterium sp.]